MKMALLAFMVVAAWLCFAFTPFTYASEDILRSESIKKAMENTVTISLHVGNTAKHPTEREDSPDIVGTGFIVEGGYIVTRRHVHQQRDIFTNTLKTFPVIYGVTSGGKEYSATLVASDEWSDIAVFKIVVAAQTDAFPQGLPWARQEPEIGDVAFMIGNPLGFPHVATFGRISKTPLPSAEWPQTLQTDMTVCLGNSGGALFNARGEVIGIVGAMALESEMNLNEKKEGQRSLCSRYGFALSADAAKRIVRDLITMQRVRRPVLGLTIHTVRDPDTHQWRVKVTDVIEGGNAERAGLRIGDIILDFGSAVEYAEEINMRMIHDVQIGDIVPVRVFRQQAQEGGKEEKIFLRIRE